MRVKDPPQVKKSKDKTLDCKEELEDLINRIPWETGKRSSELLTPKEIIKAKLWNILVRWGGNVPGMQVDKP